MYPLMRQVFSVVLILMFYHTTDIGIYFIANLLSLMQSWFHFLCDFTLMGGTPMAHLFKQLAVSLSLLLNSVNFKSFLVHTLGLYLMILYHYIGQSYNHF